MVTVIDGKNLIHGRLASNVAEMIMDGEEVIILNAEDIVITGQKEVIFQDYLAKVKRGDTTKRKGPFYPRRSDLLFKRCVRGMIPWTSTSGRDAYRRLHVFVGIPKQFEDCEKVRPVEADRTITGKYTTLGAVSKFLGSNVR
ncbi:MAG: 50S ribosomal protein L13 [Candidatus Methanomethylophilaceae archaeon]|nr:50S ribosomal protein L13 [Candidatus Methanomethylophilaceae archaeon]MDY0224372.1 50S ribosomal protein L13 [Candidatus Methanomethylophilaceae archaeon]